MLTQTDSRTALLDSHSIPHDHPAMRHFLTGNEPFEGAVEGHAQKIKTSYEIALLDLQGKRDSIAVSPALSAADAKALAVADGIRAKAAAAELERQQVAAEWERQVLQIEQLHSGEARIVSEILKVEGQLALLLDIVSGTANTHLSDPINACYTSAALGNALPAFRQLLETRRAALKDAVFTLRDFGKKHSVPAEHWPPMPPESAEPATTTV